MRLVCLMAVVFSVLSCCHGYRILAFFPFPGKSHHRVWDPLLAELAERGHHITAVKGVKMENPPSSNYKEIMVSDILKDITKKFASGDSFTRPTFIGKMQLTFFFKASGLFMGELWMKDPEIQKIMNSNESYDAVLYESAFMQEYFTVLQHRFNAVGIEVTTLGNYHWAYWIFGNPIDTSYIGDVNVEYNDHMTFLERLHLTILSSLVRLLWYNVYMPRFQTFMDQHIRYPGWESRPRLMDMVANTSLVLVNTDVALTYPHPMSPHFVEVGGINILPNKPLPKDLQEFMDGAKEGVIFFSLGSHIQASTALGESLREVFTGVFSKLKLKILWKWETSFKNPPSNIKIGKWFPQQDILAHKNLKLFMSHGGLQSTTESIYFGVPMVTIPIFGDQEKNAKFIDGKGMGVLLAFENLTHDSIHWAINEVLSQPRYKERAVHQSNLLTDKPMTPLEKAIFWTEYVIRHKGAHHLKPAIATMPWYQQAMLDVYSVMAAIVLIPIYITYKIISCFCRCIFCKKSRDVKKKKRD